MQLINQSISWLVDFQEQSHGPQTRFWMYGFQWLKKKSLNGPVDHSIVSLMIDQSTDCMINFQELFPNPK